MLILKCGMCCCNLILFSVAFADFKKIFRFIYLLLWSTANYYYLFHFPSSIEFYINELTIKSLSKLPFYIFWGLTVLISLYILGASFNIGGLRVNKDDFFTLIFYQNLFLLYKYPIFTGYYNTVVHCLPMIFIFLYAMINDYNKEIVAGFTALWVSGIFFEYFTISYSKTELWNYIISLGLQGVGYALIFSMSAGFCELIYYLSERIKNEFYSIRFLKSSRSKITMLFFEEMFKIVLIIAFMIGLFYSEVAFEYFSGYKPMIASIIIRMAFSYPLALCISHPRYTVVIRNENDINSLNLIAVFFCVNFYEQLFDFIIKTS